MSAGIKPAWFASLSVPLASKTQLAVFRVAVISALLLAAWGALIVPGQVGDRCLVSFGFLLTTGLGGLFFVLLHHVLNASWSKTSVIHARGVAELIVLAMLLLVPIALRVDESWPWFASESGHSHPGGFAQVYQHHTFLIARLVACCAAWLWLAYGYTRVRSLDAVRRGAEGTLRSLRYFSGPSLAVLALTLTSFSFDWVMTLQRDWHSAVLGVYLFAGGVPAALAMLAFMALGLARANPTAVARAGALRHDLAKLLFGFTVFWAYIAFSQYLLIWYAGIPREMQFYRLRSTSSWQWLTLSLITLRFVVPFFALLSARSKRSTLGLALAAGSVLLGHWLDWYWLIIPTLDGTHTTVGVADISMSALSIIAIAFGVLRGAARQPQVLPKSIHLVGSE